MGKAVKFALGILLGLVLVVAITLGLTIVRGGEAIRTNLEKVLTATIGTSTQIASLQINPIQGNIQLRSLQMSNPEGLTTPYLMKVDAVDVSVKPLSLLANIIEIQQVTIRNWQINIEQSLTKGNVAGIVTHLQKQMPQSATENSPVATKEVTVGAVSIDRFTTQIKLSFLQQSFDRSFMVDNVELKNINPDDAPAILLGEFIRRVVLEAFRVVFNQAKVEIRESLPTQLPNIPFLKENPLNALQNLLNSIPTN